MSGVSCCVCFQETSVIDLISDFIDLIISWPIVLNLGSLINFFLLWFSSHLICLSEPSSTSFSIFIKSFALASKKRSYSFWWLNFNHRNQMGRNLHQVQFAKEIVSVVILFLITDLVQYFLSKRLNLLYINRF